MAAAPLKASSPAVDLGWQIKAQCYEAWHTEPARAVQAAAQLRELAEQQPGAELHALAAWTAGIAHLIEGSMEAALLDFDCARTGLVEAGRAEVAAQTQVPKLMALSMLGRYEEALLCGERALAEFLAHGDQRSAGKVESNLGLMLSYLNRHEEAARLHRRAAVRFARVRDTQQSVVADINLALALSWSFDFQEALHIYERARMRAERYGYVVLQALARGGIGRLELHRGRYDRALPELALACRSLAEAGVAPQQLIEAEGWLGDAYAAVNLLPEALAVYDRIIERCDGFTSLASEAWALIERADVLKRLGQPVAAIHALMRAESLKSARGDAAAAAVACMRRAEIDLDREPEAALEVARRVAAVFEQAGLHRWCCEAGLLGARAAARLGAPDAARQGFGATLASAGGVTPVEIACQVGMGLLEQQVGRPAEAKAWLEQAAELLETQRAALPGDEFRAAFGADKQVIHDALVRLALDDTTGEASASLWPQMERARARALEISVSRAGLEAVPTVDRPDRARLRWLRDQAQQAMASGDIAAASALDGRVRALEQRILEEQRRMQLEQAASHSGPGVETAPVDTAAFCAALPEDLAIVEYQLLDDDRLVACVLSRAGAVHRVWPADGLASEVEALRFQLDALRYGANGLQAHAAQLLRRATARLQALHWLCWAPIAALVEGWPRLVVVPHRALHYVPFNALHDGLGWLMHRHEITVAPSAGVWRACAARGAASFVGAAVVGVGGANLPHVALELAAVARVFGNGATVLADRAADRQAIRAALAGTDVLHLACHGEFRADSPYFSSLTLGDGPFTLRDAAALPLAATSLVTLSACEAGRSRVAAGDELLGLLRGFLMAGVPTVVATLWTIDDAATAELMENFYARLVDTGRPAAAMRAAQQGLAERWPHPFYWGAFTVYGRG